MRVLHTLATMVAIALFAIAPANAGGFAPEGSYAGPVVQGGCGKITVYKTGSIKYLAYNCQTFKTVYKAKRTTRVGDTIYVDAAKIEGAKLAGDCIVGQWKYGKHNKKIRLCRIK